MAIVALATLPSGLPAGASQLAGQDAVRVLNYERARRPGLLGASVLGMDDIQGLEGLRAAPEGPGPALRSTSPRWALIPLPLWERARLQVTLWVWSS